MAARSLGRPLGLALAATLLLLPAPRAAAADRPAEARPGASGPAGAPPLVVYGVELEALDDRDRLLVFARREASWETREPDDETFVLRAVGAVLDPSATTRIVPPAGGAVQGVTAFEPADADPPEVHVVVRHAPGATPSVSQRGAILSVELTRPEPPEQAGLALGRGEIGLVELVRRVAEATGERFVLGDELEGRVGLELPAPLAPSEALDVLQAALLLHGRTALPGPDGTWRVVPVLSAPQSARFGDAAAGTAPVTTLVRLRAADPGAVLTALRPHVGAQGLALADRPSSSLLLAGPAPRVRRWSRLARELDRREERVVWVRRLRHRGAAELAPLVEGLGEDDPVPAAVWPAGRGDTLVARARAEDVPRLRGRLERLDVPVRGSSEVRVLRVLHADPEALATTLRSVATATAAGPEASEAAYRLADRDLVVAVDDPTHSLVVYADPTTLDVVEALVRELDREAPRIEVEVLVTEWVTSERLELGFDAFLPLVEPASPDDWIAFLLSTPSGQPLFGPGAAAAQGVARFARDPLLVPIVGPDGIPVTAVIPRETFQMTAQDQLVASRVLLHPRLRVASGETHELFAGDEVPVPVAAPAESAQTGPPLSVSQRVERRDVGLRLRVRPSLGQGDVVQLELELEASRVSPSLAGSVQEVGPTLRKRTLATTVRLEDGRWAVVGLGPEAVLQRVDRGIPWWKEIPAFGWAFEATRDVRARRELVVAARARVVR